MGRVEAWKEVDRAFWTQTAPWAPAAQVPQAQRFLHLLRTDEQYRSPGRVWRHSTKKATCYSLSSNSSLTRALAAGRTCPQGRFL